MLRSRSFEQWYPYLGAICVALIWLLFEAELPRNRGELLGSSLTFASILTGFIAASKAILVSMRGSRIFRRLQEQKFIKPILTYLSHAIWLSLGACFVSLAGFFEVGRSEWFGAIWVFIIAATVLAFIRVTKIFFAILAHPLGALDETSKK